MTSGVRGIYNTFISRNGTFRNSLSPLKRGAVYYLGFGAAVGTFIPFLNVYFHQNLGFTGRQIGILSMFFPLMTVVIAMPLSALADRYSWRISILTGAITGFGLCFLLARFPHHFLVWAAFMFCLSIFFSPIAPLSDSLIARMSLRHNLNYGSMRLWASVSFALAAIGGGALWERIGFGAMFTIAGILFFPLLFFASHLEECPVIVGQQIKVPVLEILRDAGLVVLLATSFLVGAALRLSVMFDGIYMRYLDGTQFFVGLMFGLAAFCESPTMQYSAKVIRRLSGPKTLLLAYGTLIVAFLGYVLVWQPWMLLLMAMVKGLGFGLFYVSTVQLITIRAPESRSSTVQAMLTASIFGLAPLIAAPFGGELYDRFGLEAVFLCASLGVGGATLILLTAIVKGVFSKNI
jgi:PPP family 3-phenylpropionic acid transporter